MTQYEEVKEAYGEAHRVRDVPEMLRLGKMLGAIQAAKAHEPIPPTLGLSAYTVDV